MYTRLLSVCSHVRACCAVGVRCEVGAHGLLPSTTTTTACEIPTEIKVAEVCRAS